MNKTIFAFLILPLAMCACTSKKEEKEKVPILMRKPYLQSAIADSVSILWRTDIGSKSKVAYKQVGMEEWVTKEGLTRITNTQLIENEVTLKKLAPSTKYQYRILTDDQPLLTNQALQFLSSISEADTVFSFLAVGDIGEPVEEGGTPDQLAKALESFVDSLNFGLLLGDIVYPDGKSEDYDKNLFQYFGGVFPYMSVFTILGNHDWHEPEENYMKEWKLPGNEHYYSFDFGHVHFIALDSKKGDLYNYKEQVAWLEQDLLYIPDEIVWKVVFLHHNGKSCAYKKPSKDVVSLYPLFERYNVDLVLNGHVHTYERLNPMNGKGEVVSENEGFTSITIGSGGKLRGVGTDPQPFVPNPDSCKYPGLVAAFTHDWAFLKLDINGKRLTGTAYTTKDLKEVDHFEITK